MSVKYVHTHTHTYKSPSSIPITHVPKSAQRLAAARPMGCTTGPTHATWLPMVCVVGIRKQPLLQLVKALLPCGAPMGATRQQQGVTPLWSAGCVQTLPIHKVVYEVVHWVGMCTRTTAVKAQQLGVSRHVLPARHIRKQKYKKKQACVKHEGKAHSAAHTYTHILGWLCFDLYYVLVAFLVHAHLVVIRSVRPPTLLLVPILNKRVLGPPFWLRPPVPSKFPFSLVPCLKAGPEQWGQRTKAPSSCGAHKIRGLPMQGPCGALQPRGEPQNVEVWAHGWCPTVGRVYTGLDEL